MSLIVFGGTTLALGVGTLVYVAQDQSGMKDLSDGPIAALSVLGIAAGLPMVLGGIAVLSSEGPDGEPTVKAAVGPTWVGIEGTF